MSHFICYTKLTKRSCRNPLENKTEAILWLLLLIVIIISDILPSNIVFFCMYLSICLHYKLKRFVWKDRKEAGEERRNWKVRHNFISNRNAFIKFVKATTSLGWYAVLTKEIDDYQKKGFEQDKSTSKKSPNTHNKHPRFDLKILLYWYGELYHHCLRYWQVTERCKWIKNDKTANTSPKKECLKLSKDKTFQFKI